MPSRRKDKAAAQDEEDARDRKKPTLVNISGRGLCFVLKNGSLNSAGDVSMIPVGRARDPSLNLKGFIWLLKFYPSGEKVYVYIDKSQMKSPDLFERAVDTQTEGDCNFRIKGGSMWTTFINDSLSRVTNDQALANYSFVKHLGPDKFCEVREGEVWAFGPDTYLDNLGNKISARKIWLTPNICKNAQELPEVKWKPGDTDYLMAKVFDVLTPFNTVPCLMAIAGGLQSMHGRIVRQRTDGQLPSLMIRSRDSGTGSGGKGQGKSGTAKLVMWLVSNMENHKLDPEVSKEEFKKFANSTGLLICIEDIKNFNKLSQILAWQYDSSMTYRNKEGSYTSKGECMATANAVHVDECHGDRLAGITFENWGHISTAEFTRKREKFNALLNSPERPTNFTIGEAGDFFRSEEYYERRKYWADYMLELCEVVKIRTLETNYAGMIATLEFLYKRFPILSTKHGISWEDTIIKWIKEEWVEQIQRAHVEKDNAANYIRRYLAGLDSFTEGMTETHVKKFLRITPTGKIAGQKFALAFHPDRLLPFGELNGATLDLVRTHVVDVGGLVDTDTERTKTAWSWFVKPTVDDDNGEVELSAANKEQCCNKRCLLIPINMLSSAMFMKFADKTGQTDLYSLVDSETPSGVSRVAGHSNLSLAPNNTGVVHNSTAVTSGNDFHLELSEIESPMPVRSKPPSFTRIEETIGEVNASEFDEDDQEDDDAPEEDTIEEIEENEVSKESHVSNRVRNGKITKKKQNSTVTIQGVLYHPCDICGKTFTTSSGRSRHKCSQSPNNTTIAIRCDLCSKTFTTTAGRTKHIKIKHKPETTNSNQGMENSDISQTRDHDKISQSSRTDNVSRSLQNSTSNTTNTRKQNSTRNTTNTQKQNSTSNTTDTQKQNNTSNTTNTRKQNSTSNTTSTHNQNSTRNTTNTQKQKSTSNATQTQQNSTDAAPLQVSTRKTKAKNMSLSTSCSPAINVQKRGVIVESSLPRTARRGMRRTSSSRRSLSRHKSSGSAKSK